MEGRCLQPSNNTKGTLYRGKNRMRLIGATRQEMILASKSIITLTITVQWMSMSTMILHSIIMILIMEVTTGTQTIIHLWGIMILIIMPL